MTMTLDDIILTAPTWDQRSVERAAEIMKAVERAMKSDGTATKSSPST
jgi:hypothetical protein